MQESEINEAFRAEVREWMAQHLTGKFAPLKHAAGLGSEGYDPQLAKEWEQELAKGGWTGLGWEVQYGGRNAPLAQQVIFHEEYVRCGGPGRIGHIGETLLAPTLIAAGAAVPASDALPRYIRDKVAQTTAERAALRAAQAVATPPSSA